MDRKGRPWSFKLQQAGLKEQVQFLGFRSDPQKFLLQAGVFVLPSRFEGMPNALLEAMAVGLRSGGDGCVAGAAGGGGEWGEWIGGPQ